MSNPILRAEAMELKIDDQEIERLREDGAEDSDIVAANTTDAAEHLHVNVARGEASGDDLLTLILKKDDATNVKKKELLYS